MIETLYRTKEQADLARELCQAYHLQPEQITFNDNSLSPNFDFEALSRLALELADIADLSIDLDRIDNQNNLAICRCVIELGNGQTRSVFAVCGLGEQLQDGSTITYWDQATNIARVRALRTGLRAIGFDPLRAHLERAGGGEKLTLGGAEPNEQKQLREIHALAEELGYIRPGDDSAYRNLLKTFFPPHTSAKNLTNEQRQQFIVTLRALARVKTPTNEMAKAA